MKKAFLLNLLILTITAMAQQPLKYEVLYEKQDLEVRHYAHALVASVSNAGSLFSDRGNSFSILADYIFGNNADSNEIGMTSPVIMEADNNTFTMRFIMPENYELSTLPPPAQEEIKLEKYPPFYALAVTFGGYSNPEKVHKHRQMLLDFAAQHNLSHDREFLLLGYDPPFKVINRKNEFLLKLTAPPEAFQP